MIEPSATENIGRILTRPVSDCQNVVRNPGIVRCAARCVAAISFEVGALCGNSALTDQSEGYRVTGIPTGISWPDTLISQDPKNWDF